MKTQSQTIRDNETFRARSQNARIDSKDIIENLNQKELDRLETSIFLFKFAFSFLIKFKRKFRHRHLDRRLIINFSKETITNVKLFLLNNIDENLVKFAIDDLEKLKIEIIENFANDSRLYNECESITSLWMSNIDDLKKSVSLALERTNNWKLKRQRKLIRSSISKQLLIVFNNMSSIIEIVYKYVKSTYKDWEVWEINISRIQNRCRVLTLQILLFISNCFHSIFSNLYTSTTTIFKVLYLWSYS